MLRSLAAIVAGYLVFAVAGGALFQLTGQDPHGPATLGFIVGSTLYGLGFAGLAGWIAARVAPARRAWPWEVSALATLVAVGALVSTVLAARRGHAVWSSVAALVLMAPVVLLGGRAARRQP